MEINILNIDIDLAKKVRYNLSLIEDNIEYNATFKFDEEVDMVRLEEACRQYVELVKIKIINIYD